MKKTTISPKEKKKQPENPLHREYGILRNLCYTVQNIKKYSPVLLLLMAVGAVSNAAMQLLGSFAGKYVIDAAMLQAESGDKSFMPLIKLMLALLAAYTVVWGLNTFSANRRYFYFIYVRLKLITERVSKALSMNYQNLERPQILDMHEKACMAGDNNHEGVEGMMHSLDTMLVQVLLLAVSLSVVLTLDFRLVLLIIVVSFFQHFFFRRTVKKDKEEVRDKLSPTWRKINYMRHVTQDFSYAKDIRLFHTQDWLSGKLHSALMEKQERILYGRNLWIYNSILAHGTSTLQTLAVYVVLIFSFMGRGMTIGNFTLYLGLAATFSSALTEVLNTAGELKKQSLLVDDFRSFLELAEDEEGDCIPLPETDSYTFTFRNVSFRYEGAEGYALKNLNLTLQAGERLAVVGLNGAGKTTLIKLLLRLYDVSEGVILLNGVDIRRFRRKEYFTLFAPAFQDVEIFAYPISENVSMKPPKETDCALARKYLEQAGLVDKLEELKDGVHTELLKVLHEDGVDLSGGEKQKLALARALYKEAPIVVLDEPTSALDALAEYRLYKSFDEIIGKKSALYISHRLSSTRFCDNIAMFVDGEMVEYGTHDALLAKQGAYAEMFAIQAQYYKDEEVQLHEK